MTLIYISFCISFIAFLNNSAVVLYVDYYAKGGSFKNQAVEGRKKNIYSIWLLLWKFLIYVVFDILV